MKLGRAARYFNKNKYFDAYTNEYLGDAQLDLFDDSKRDGLTAQRRILEVEIGTPVPERKCILLQGKYWLLGVDEQDLFLDKVIREKHVLHLAEDLAQYQTPLQYLSEEEGTKAYASRVWVKSSSEVEIDSDKFNQVNIYFARTETPQAEMIVSLSGRLYIVRSVYMAAAGHLVAASEELDVMTTEVIELSSEGVWDPIEETFTGGEVVNVKLLRLRWQSDFEYYSQRTPNFARGDIQAVCNTKVETGKTLTLADGQWQVVNLDSRNSVHYLHLRRLEVKHD